MSRPVLLDTSFLIALERETLNGEQGPARRFLPSLRGRRIAVSIVSVEELLEGASDEASALASLQRFSIQGLHLGQAQRCALLQRRATRRMGENDAWLVATAESIGADIVGPTGSRSSVWAPGTCAFGDAHGVCQATGDSAGDRGREHGRRRAQTRQPPSLGRCVVVGNLEARHAPVVLDVPRHDRHAERERRGGDPEVVPADQEAVRLEIPIRPAVLPAHVRVERQDVERAEELLPPRAVRQRGAGREFARPP